MMDEGWTIQRVIDWSVSFLREKKIDSARLDVELLLSHTLSCRRIDLYTRFDMRLSESERGSFRDLLRRRHAYEPVAYILGSREFYGREFAVRDGVLIPRPETELLIDQTRPFLPDKSRVLDIGSGSGCIAVTLAAEAPAASVTALDRSSTAVALTRENAARHNIPNISVVEEDLAAYDGGPFDLIVSNPPYIAPGEYDTLMPDVRGYEPRAALVADDNGYAVYRLLARRLPGLLAADGTLLLECGAGMAPTVADLLGPFFRNTSRHVDLHGIERVVTFSGYDHAKTPDTNTVPVSGAAPGH